MEELLYYVWQYHLFAIQPLETTKHISVEVIDVGLRNRNAGPDFLNAKIKIGNTYWVGNVEMHISSSDWYRHKHDANPAYDSVILHVVGQLDELVYRTNGEEIPQLVLPISAQIRQRYSELSSSDIRPKCYSSILGLDKFTIHSWMSSLEVERLEVKTDRIMELYTSGNYLWPDVLFITLARNFGFGLNGDVFERWAKKLPFRAMDKHRDSLLQVEAICFGLAGLLDQNEEGAYSQTLQKEFTFLASKFGLSEVSYPWQLAKIRPGSFPNVRIAQLAWLYHSNLHLCDQLVNSRMLDDMYSLLYVETSEYWDTHYSFGKVSPKRAKRLGNKAMDLLVINTLVPFLYAYGKHKGDDELQRRSIELLSQVKPENNYITRMWEQANIFAESAADSQALIQLQKEYCDKKNCLRCRFGYIHLCHK